MKKDWVSLTKKEEKKEEIVSMLKHKTVSSQLENLKIKIMEFSGKIIAVLPMQTGSGRNGEWKKQEYVIETHDQYPKKMCFNLWGDKIDQFAIQAGEEMTVSFDIDCREYNGRWYNDIRAWKVERGQAGPAGPDSFAQAAPSAAPVDFSATDAKDDLPF